ncbi:MAG: Fe-S oxidoreductase FadF [SAR324 cluster bacterium]|uniref:Fe-S oxidoreductase FadF n=1 Tax=SAR324 cluster bacterium TaxID=2024889 RepID=A0A2A4SRR3_9DELT|nr:MAG: Fe-S oxidoreductase FadF [SAR324 cluster bacterium]
MNPFAISILLILAMSTFVWFVYQKVMLLSSLGKEDRLDNVKARISTMLTIAFAQKRLIGRKKERPSGIMHAFIFWGFLVLGIRTITLGGEGFQMGFHLPFLGQDSIIGYLYLALKDVMEGIVLCMILFAAYRRAVTKPKRLTNSFEAWFVLVMIGTLMATDLLYDGARFNLIQIYESQDIHWFNNPAFGPEYLWTPIASLFAWLMSGLSETGNVIVGVISYWLHMITVLTFLCFLPMGKHAHVITAIPNVFLSSVGYPHTPAKKLDLEDEAAWEDESLGVNHIHQFTWKQGLDLITCTECGRCMEVCPTYVTNKPLNLKSFNTSLKHELFDNMDNIIKRAALEKKLQQTEDEAEQEQIKEQMQALLSTKQLVGDVIAEDTLWACTTCRACEQVCPVGIEHVPRIIELRQGQTLMAESYPKELNVAYKGLDRNSNPWGIGYDKRADWAKGLGITTMAENPDVDYLLWVGCAGSFDDRGQKVARATAKILQAAGISFSILGTEEKCTGDFARRAGNEMLFQSMAEENVEILNGYKITKIIATCPHCLNTLGNEYPQFNGNYELIHHSQFISQLIEEGKIKVKKSVEGKITYHDPCYLGRYNKIFDEPRNIIGSIAKEGLTEMPRNREESFCCGAGGARMWMEETIGERINVNRVQEAVDMKADKVVVACPFCLTMVDDGIKTLEQEEKMETIDLAELVWQTLEKHEA